MIIVLTPKNAKFAGRGKHPTKDFRESIRERAQRQPAFRALLREAIEQMLNGDLETGKSVIRNDPNVTIGFQPSRTVKPLAANLK